MIHTNAMNRCYISYRAYLFLHALLGVFYIHSNHDRSLKIGSTISNRVCKLIYVDGTRALAKVSINSRMVQCGQFNTGSYDFRNQQ